MANESDDRRNETMQNKETCRNLSKANSLNLRRMHVEMWRPVCNVVAFETTILRTNKLYARRKTNSCVITTEPEQSIEQALNKTTMKTTRLYW